MGSVGNEESIFEGNVSLLSSRSSSQSPMRSTTRPLPITHLQLSRRMPEGVR